MLRRHNTKEPGFVTRSEGNEMRIEGYFIVFDSETEIYPGYYEKIDRHAIDKSLRENDIVCLFNHDTGKVLGRMSNGTFTVRTDDKGAWGSVIINPDDAEAVSIYHRVARGDIKGCSFGFDPVKQVSDIRDDGTHWIVTEADTAEMSVCTFPAYEQTDIQARSKDMAEMRKNSLAERKAKLKSKLEVMRNGSKIADTENAG